MTAWVWAVGRMLGLGEVSGMRPSLTLAVIGIVSALHWGPGVNSLFAWLDHWPAILIFVVLAIFESSFDKISRWDRLQGRLTVPYRVVVGACAGAATIHLGWQGIVAGALVGAVMAWVSQHTKGISRPKTTQSDVILSFRSLWEDLATFGGALVTLLFSPFGYVLAAVEGTSYYLFARRRRNKYRDLARLVSRAGPSGTGPGGTEEKPR